MRARGSGTELRAAGGGGPAIRPEAADAPGAGAAQDRELPAARRHGGARWPASSWVALLMAVAGGGAVLDGWHWPLRARLFPLIVGLTIFFLSLIELVSGLRAAPQAVPAADVGEGHGAADIATAPLEARRVRGLIAWVSALVVALWLFGFPLTVPVYLFLMLRVWARERTLVAALLAAAGWAFVYLVVERWVHLPLPAGVLEAWLP